MYAPHEADFLSFLMFSGDFNVQGAKKFWGDQGFVNMLKTQFGLKAGDLGFLERRGLDFYGNWCVEKQLKKA
jgi:hypothetical protein